MNSCHNMATKVIDSPASWLAGGLMLVAGLSLTIGGAFGHQFSLILSGACLTTGGMGGLFGKTFRLCKKHFEEKSEEPSTTKEPSTKTTRPLFGWSEGNRFIENKDL